MARKDDEIRRTDVLNETENSQFDRIKEETMERRGFVKGALASVGGLAASSGISAAESDGLLTRIKKRRAIRPYKSIEAVETAFEGHEDLLSDIATKTSLSAGEIDALEINSLGHPGEESETGVTYATKKIDGEYVPEIRVMREVEEGKLTIAVIPDIDKRYARLNLAEEDDSIVFEELSTQGFCGGCPSNKQCEREVSCCESNDCPSCTCYECETWSCRCYKCGTNCIFECP
jgi:hypothetical protein